MDLFLFILTLVASGVACGAAAVSAYSARKNNVARLRSDVAEMLDAVDKMAGDVRSAKMSRVRQARADAPAPSDAPAELRPTQTPLPLTKDQLRSKVLGH